MLWSKQSHVKCGRETLSRDAKTSESRTTVEASIEDCARVDSNVQSVYTSSSLPSPKHHICQNGRSPRKEVPRPCWCVSNACAASPHCDLSRRMCTVADFSCYSPPHGSLLHCRFVNTIYACAISRKSWILILLPSQAPSSSTASTRSPLLSPTVSSTQHPQSSLVVCAAFNSGPNKRHGKNKTADKLYSTKQPTSTATTPATPTRTLSSPPTRYASSERTKGKVRKEGCECGSIDPQEACVQKYHI